MSGAAQHSSGSRANRRRRRVIMLQAAAHTKAALPLRPHCPIVAGGFDSLSLEPSISSGLAQRLGEFLASERPRTWVVVGDTLLGGQQPSASETESRGWRGCFDLFADDLRGPLQRPYDPLVNMAAPGCRLAEIAEHRNPLRMGLRPDVLWLSLSPADFAKPGLPLAAFEEQMAALLSAWRAAVPVVILSTPPLVVDDAHSSEGIQSAVTLAAARSLAAEYDAGVVDHSEHWQHYAVRHGLAGSWFTEQGAPSAIGHLQLSRHILDELQEWNRGFTGKAMVGAPVAVRH